LKKAEQPQIKKPDAVVDNVHKKLQEEDTASHIAKRHKGWLSAIFGGVMFFTSSAGLYLLYKYRRHFSL
jgi:hypothetical protein